MGTRRVSSEELCQQAAGLLIYVPDHDEDFETLIDYLWKLKRMREQGRAEDEAEAAAAEKEAADSAAD